MRVEVRYDEQPQGIIFKRTLSTLVITVDFSEEEKQIIKERQLQNLFIEITLQQIYAPKLHGGILRREPHERVSIADLTLHRTWIMQANAATHLRGMEEMFLKCLQAVKQLIDQNRTVGRSKVIEI
jgi:hypothetical protein